MLYSDEGFVIRKTDMLNEDKVIGLFLREHGRVSAVAKGVKRIASKKSGNLELLNLCSFSLAVGKNLDILTEVRLINDFDRIRATSERVFFLFYIDELMNKMVYDGEINSDIFDLVRDVLLYVNGKEELSLKKVLIYLNSKMLVYSGVFPQLYECVVCGVALEAGEEKVYVRSGIAHEECSSGTSISDNMIKVLRYIKEHSLEEYMHLIFDEKLEKSLYLLTITMIEYTIDAVLTSKVYIHE